MAKNIEVERSKYKNKYVVNRLSRKTNPWIWVVKKFRYYEWEACISEVSLSNLREEDIEVELSKYKNKNVVNMISRKTNPSIWVVKKLRYYEWEACITEVSLSI